MTLAHKEALRDRLVTSLIAALVTSLVPVIFALVSGLWSAPKRLGDLEVQLARGAYQDSTQTAVLTRMGQNIELLTLMRCMDRQQRDGDAELYARLNCAAAMDSRRPRGYVPR